MTHKIYWAERGLRYLYEVVVAEVHVYILHNIYETRSAVYGCHLDRRNISVVLSDQGILHRIIFYHWTSGACGTFSYLAGHSIGVRMVTGIYDIGYLLPCAVAYAKRGCRTYRYEQTMAIDLSRSLYFASIGMKLSVLSNLSYIAGCITYGYIYDDPVYTGVETLYHTQQKYRSDPFRDIAVINGRVVLFLAVLVLLLMGACDFLDLSGFVNVLARAFAKVVQTVFGAIMVIWVFVLVPLLRRGSATTVLNYQDTLNEYYQNSVKGYDVFTLILKVFVVLLIFFLVRILLQVIRFLFEHEKPCR